MSYVLLAAISCFPLLYILFNSFLIFLFSDYHLSIPNSTVGEQKISQIGRGLCVLLGITHEDDQSDADYIVKKLLQIRLFEDDKGKPWALSATQLDLDLLIVSQFTLYARLKGNKPDYHLSAGSQPAQALFDKIIQQLRKEYKADKVHTGMQGQAVARKLAETSLKVCVTT